MAIRLGASGTWQIDFSVRGRRVQRSSFTTNKQEALELEARLRKEAWDERLLERKPPRTWDEGVRLFLRRKAAKRSIEDDRDKFRWFASTPIAKLNLNEVTSAALSDTLERKRKEGVSESTIAHYAALVSAMLNVARAEGWIDAVPAFPRITNDVRRVVWITRERAQRLIDALSGPAIVISRLAHFSLSTGLRQHNATHLTWRQVDLQRKVAWVDATAVKNRRSLSVPLNSEAVAILEAQRGKSDTWCFPSESIAFRGSPIDNPAQQAWRRACKEVGIYDEHPDWRWHDLRHTWASWHVMSGTPPVVLMELGGWSSYDMVLRYAHLAPGHAAAWAENVVPKDNQQPLLRIVK